LELVFESGATSEDAESSALSAGELSDLATVDCDITQPISSLMKPLKSSQAS
jgi:hypothetical protein